jgi:hypothetical protein
MPKFYKMHKHGLPTAIFHPNGMMKFLRTGPELWEYSTENEDEIGILKGMGYPVVDETGLPEGEELQPKNTKIELPTPGLRKKATDAHASILAPRKIAEPSKARVPHTSAKEK